MTNKFNDGDFQQVCNGLSTSVRILQNNHENKSVVQELS